MFIKHCDHCCEIVQENKKEVKIHIGNYIDSADLCDTCQGKLIHIVEAFLNGDEFEKKETEVDDFIKEIKGEI